MHALLKVSPGVSDEDLRHACRQQTAEVDGDMAWDMQQRIAAAEPFLLSQRQDLYGQQLSALFSDKLQQLPVRILQKVREHSQDRDHGKLRDVFVVVEDLQLLQDLMPALRSEEVRTQVHRAVNGHARESEHQISAGWSSHHEDASALRTFRVGFVALQDLNAMFSAHPEIYSDEFLSRKSQLKDDIESTAAQALGFFSDEEGEAKHSMPCVV